MTPMTLSDAVHQFPHPLVLVDDDYGMPVIGFMFNGVAVQDPHVSDCGLRAMVPEARGLTKAQSRWLSTVNAAIDMAAERAIDAGCAEVRGVLGIANAEMAGRHFAELPRKNAVRQVFARCIVAELVYAGAAFADGPGLEPVSAVAS